VKTFLIGKKTAAGAGLGEGKNKCFRHQLHSAGSEKRHLQMCMGSIINYRTALWPPRTLL
jgi:hypothetical protein